MPPIKKTGQQRFGNSFNIASNTGSKQVVAQSSNFINTSIPAPQQSNTIIIDLNNSPAVANIVRDGYKVPSVIPDNDRLSQYLSGLKPITPTKTPRVLGQSIAPGTRVSEGTEVDLVLAPREDISIGIFDDIHIGVIESNIGDLLEKVKDQTQIQDLVLKYDKPDQVAEQDKEVLVGLLGEFAGLEVDESKTGQSFSNAFNTMQIAYSFK